MAKRLNTQLEAEGAEFLVLGNLLILGVSAYKAYHNFKSYDLIAVNPELNISLKIQVKSRFQTDWDGFIIKDLDCDFVVVVALNRGYKTARKAVDSGIKDPDYFVFPIEYIKSIERSEGWGKVMKSSFWEDRSEYQNNWQLIRKELGYQ